MRQLTVQFSGRGACGEVAVPFGTSFVDVSSEARGDLWAPPRGDEGGFERPKPQTLFQAMMSSVKPGTIAGQVRQLAAASNQLTQLPQPSTLPVASPSHAASTAHS
jgi:hypothetical protein